MFPSLLAAILNFCVKCKNMFISITERDRAISTKVLTLRVSADSTGDFCKNYFPATFGGHLKFLCCSKNAFISVMERDRAISMQFIDRQSRCRVYWLLLSKNVFPPLLASIFNFCIKRKNTFISETEQKSFSQHFWRPS